MEPGIDLLAVEAEEAELETARAVTEAKADGIPLDREPWWTHHPDHMKGWEAFGVVGHHERPRTPTVRRLGTHSGPGGGKPGTVPFHKDEVRQGVSHIAVGTSADSPGTAFVQVYGTSEKAVTDAYERVVAVWKHLVLQLWPGFKPPKESEQPLATQGNDAK